VGVEQPGLEGTREAVVGSGDPTATGPRPRTAYSAHSRRGYDGVAFSRLSRTCGAVSWMR